jgi:putative DNA primase/helicase
LVVIDESFFQTCLRGVEGPLKSRPFICPDQLRGTRYVPMKGGIGGYDMDATEELSGLSQRAADLLEGDKLSPKAFLAAGFTAADARRAVSLEYSRREASDISPAMKIAAQRERLQGQQAGDVSRFGRFWAVLARELEDAPDRDAFYGIVPGEMETDAGTVSGFFLRWSNDLRKHVLDAPVLVLDATADVTILRRFLPDLPDLIEIEAQWENVEVIQVTDTVTAKSYLVPSAGASPEELQRRENRREDLRQLAEAEVETARKNNPRMVSIAAVLAITYKGAVQNEDGTALIKPVPGADFAWLNALRGKDGWRDVDTLIIAGRTQPNASTIEAMTAALFYADAKPIQSVGGDRYEREVRGYRMADKSHWGVETACLPDPRAEAVRRQVCEAELVQAIGRARPARRTADRRLKVLIRTSIPLPITVNRLTTTHEMAPTVVEVLLARRAVPVKPWADLAEAHPSLFETAEAARKAITRLIPDKPLYKILIGECPELARAAYRRPRQGQRATTGMLLYDPARIDPALWLAEHLPGAEVIQPKQAKTKTKPKPAEARPVPRTLADLHARLAGLNVVGFTAHNVRTGTGKPFGQRRALVIRCGTAAPSMFTPAGLVPAAVAATPFDDLFVPDFRASGRSLRPRSRVVALDIPLDDPKPADRPLHPGPLRLVHPEDASITNQTGLPNNFGTA